MAIQINAGEDVKRGDRFFLDPFAVITKEELRGRHIPPTEEQIIELAISMLTFGQLQAVVGRRDADNRVVVVAGFTRTAAARLIRKGFTFEDQEYKDEEFRLQVVLKDCNDEEAFLQNIVENAQRNETSPIDDANNQRRLRDSYGKSDAEIARIYGYKSQNKVASYRRLLLLSEEERDLVHFGLLAVSAALDLLDAPAEQRVEIVEKARLENGRISGSMIRAQVRDEILGEGSSVVVTPSTEVSEEGVDTTPTPVPSNKKKPRTMREVKTFLRETIDNEETNEEVRNFCKVFQRFIEGSVGTRAVTNAFDKIAA